MKYNFLCPCAGLGSRFVNAGYHLPKPLLQVDGKLHIEHSLSSVVLDECNLIFVVREEHIQKFDIDKILRDKFGTVTIISTSELNGAVGACLLAEKYINNDLPLIIDCLDVVFRPTFNPNKLTTNPTVLIFKANSPNYSYVRLDDCGNAIELKEKKVISNNALAGIYTFSTGKQFIKYAKKMVNDPKWLVNNEFYLSPLYNLLIQEGIKINVELTENIHVIGTPEELNFYKQVVLPKVGQKPLALISDHSGFHIKQAAIKKLGLIFDKFIDYGCYTNKDCDYNEYVALACNAISNGEVDFAFGFCRTGQGINIAANKFKGVRAALVYDKNTAIKAREHNAANFFSIPEVSEDVLFDILSAVTLRSFLGGRHTNRVQKIMELDADR